MDFRVSYTRDQQAFRAAVRAWLEEHVPRDLEIPPDGTPLAPDTQEQVKEFRRKLGTQGWIAPSWPKEYGGGGLSSSLEVVIQEELRLLDLPSMGDNHRWIPAMMVWGTEEQKRRYVTPALRGESITWQVFNEPNAGSDLASLKTHAVWDGNDYIITGEKAFITGRFDPDYMFTLAVTDRDRPQRLNLGVFMVDARSSGITIRTQRLLMGSERRLHLDNVPVSADCLVGSTYQGWEIAQTILERERGGFAFRTTEEGTIKSIHKFLKDERDRS